MTRDELLRRLRRAARKNGVSLEVDLVKGRGGHAEIRYAGRKSFAPSGEIAKGTLATILKQLGLRRSDI